MGDVAVETHLRDDNQVNGDKASELDLYEEASSFSSSSLSLLDDEEEDDPRPSLTSAAARSQDLCGFRLFAPRSSFLIDTDTATAATTFNNNNNSSDPSTSSMCMAWDTTTKKRHRSTTDTAADWRPLLCPGNTNNNNTMTISPSFTWLSNFVSKDNHDDDEDDATSPFTAAERALEGQATAPSTDLSRPRQVWIVTTASLPWMTGTAVNPLLRAAYLYEYYHQQAAAITMATTAATATTNETPVYHDEDGIFYDSAETQPPPDDNHDDHYDEEWKITLVLPWLERAQDRVELYGTEWIQATPADQEAYIRDWLANKAQQPLAAQHLHISWYRGRYYTPYRSIFPAQDICQVLQQQCPVRTATGGGPHCPVCILEEPEHLLLYRAMQTNSNNSNNSTTTSTATTTNNNNSNNTLSLLKSSNSAVTDKHPLDGFYTLSIIHTNYKSYAAQGGLGFVSEMLAGALCAVVAQAYTDKIIKLSATLQSYAPHKETVCNVHGIRQDFLHVPSPTGDDVYFIGKLLWAKGLDKLLRYQRLYHRRTGQYFGIDIYGSGPDEAEIQAAFGGRKALPAKFCGRLDHAALPTRYKIFCNPSISEVLCTTSAEALAMNKFVLMPKHPSNAFFEGFSNALLYTTPQEFCSLLLFAQSHDPVPLSDELRHRLSWQAATERLIQAAATSPREMARQERLRATRDYKCYEWHAGVCGGRFGKTLQKSFFGTFEEEPDNDQEQ